jgi:hypothetical protein
MHGIVSLERSSVFGDMGLDGALLLEDEIRVVVSAATPRAGDGGHSG